MTFEQKLAPHVVGPSELARQLGVSRQRAWAIIRSNQGRCRLCGKPECAEVKGYCSTHREAENRRHLRSYHERKARTA
jgi:hypothetical protein